MAIYLLDHGADVNAKGTKGFTPLSCAAQEGRLPVVDLLILREADLNCQHFVVDQAANSGNTALSQASLTGYLEVVDYLLSAGANINHHNAKGISALYDAAQGGHLKAVKLLVKRGANILFR